MEYIVTVGEWLGLDAVANSITQAVDAAWQTAGPVRWILGAVILVVVALAVGRLLGGGRW